MAKTIPEQSIAPTEVALFSQPMPMTIAKCRGAAKLAMPANPAVGQSSDCSWPPFSAVFFGVQQGLPSPGVPIDGTADAWSVRRVE